MKKLSLISALMFLLVGLSGCQQNNQVDYETEAEVIDGDFIYRLSTEKAAYGNDEPVTIYAELEYTDDQEEIEITHAASPFSFPMVEKTRNYEIEYFMHEPLVFTTLTRGEPLREEYSGGQITYNYNDEEEYKAFLEQFTDQKFPEGHYVVTGIADFNVPDNEGPGEDIEYNIRAEIEFSVHDRN
ncbi:hypothetical protein KP77_11080 [Jeotgalibacillus alimentarius]|uniref:Uncharacterized protein n=1 Tax=Jeotgalibacillus alimentarius TaxID=135826 RepID=A0A0C2W4S6_9BACL|nr:hypothetical protein [Jeotgalibacillus alimentarius]KIL51596.1 hypothetical protein KP77_11080 [Jeotgalibacillus alimentarius]